MAKFKSTAKSAPAASKRAASKRAASKKTAKPAARKTARPATADAVAGAQAIMDSAQQIWQTGITALGRAQQEGTRLFENLVKEGAGIEQKTRNIAAKKVSSVRKSMQGSVENRVDQVKDRAADTWDRLEKLFEERVQRALTRLGVPGREELQSLIKRVDELNARLRELAGQAAKSVGVEPGAVATKKAATKKPPAAKKAAAAKKTTTAKRASTAAGKPATAADRKPTAMRKAPAKKAAARKTATAKPVSKKASTAVGVPAPAPATVPSETTPVPSAD